MHERYESEQIAKIWSDEHKLALWQETELAVIEARAVLGQISEEIYEKISEILKERPIDVEWWKKKDNEIHHDLNAFLEERLRFIPSELQVYFHKDITSYDTEESPFVQMLKQSSAWVESRVDLIKISLKEMAQRYRYIAMNGRTHGQEAQLQTFGKRCLGWLGDIELDMGVLDKSLDMLECSKLSGAIGNYGSMDPELEKETLEILCFEPYYGATQIMPRELYAPIAQALCQIVFTLDKIATAIRLGARSGRPIYQEPFGKKQKGSSAMPHKKNTISCEKIEGMARMAKGYLSMIIDNIKTWEERAIEQSSVERVGWPDLFHVVMHSLKVMKNVLDGLRVYPDNMLLEIVESCGCYASNEAKTVLSEIGISHGLTTEDAYRIVQLAAFNAFEPAEEIKQIRENTASSLNEADELLLKLKQIPRPSPVSIQQIIARGELKASDELEATKEDVQRWNEVLKEIFQNEETLKHWNQIFLPSFLLRNEKKLYQEILGE